jgi:large subunit ribosomal protein L10
LNANNKIYLADCSSLSVEKVNQFRRACFAKNVSVSVVKNTLLEKALEQAADSRLVELIPALKGATALIFTEVGNAPAKLIKEFQRKR